MTKTCIYFCILFWFSQISTLNSLNESETAEIENKIKNVKYCKNYLNAVCCADNIRIFSSGSTLYNSDAAINQQSSSNNGDAEFSKVAIFHGLDIGNLNEVTILLQNKYIETLKIVGSTRLTSIVFKRQSTLSSFSSSLQFLDLSFNSITFQFQDEMYAFIHTTLIKDLNLSHNKIGSTDILMKALEYLKNLKNLYLNNNRNLNFGQSTFPATLGQLEFLDLSFCHIWSVDENMFNNLRNLKNLHLEGNALSVIPKSLCLRPSSLQIYLAKTHIDKKYRNNLQKNCTVKTTFEFSLSTEKSFRIIDDDRWNLSVWFYLFILAGFVNFCLVLYSLYSWRGNHF